MTTQISTTNIQPAALAFIQGPVVSSIQITNSSYTVLDDTAVDTAGGYIRINGVNFVAGMNVVIGSVTATSVSVVSGTVLNVQVPAQSAGTYIVYVIAPDGGVSIVVNGLTYSGIPSWVTGSTLTSGQVNQAISIQLDATGATSYALAAGSSLPAGLTLSSSGLLSGTVTGITVQTLYNFTVNAIDAELQDSPRAFSITIAANDQYFSYVSSLLSANTPASTFVTDASTNSFAVTVNGDTRPSNFGPYTPGYYSGFFDGNGDYLTLTYNATAFDWWTTNYTIEAWIYPTTLTGWSYLDGSVNKGTLVGSNNFNGTGNNWSLGLNSSGNLWWAYYTGANQGGGTSNTVTLNAWNHVAMVVNGTNITLYLNGIGTSLGNIVGTPVSGGTPLTIGAGNNTYINGYVSNLRIVKGTAVYTSNFTPSTVPLTAITNTQLLTCQSNRFIDNSTNNFTITRNGDTLISGFDPFVPSGSFAGRGSGFFDGTGDFLSAPDNEAFNLTGDFTIECWLYPTSHPTAVYLIGQTSSTDYAPVLLFLSSGRPGIAVSSNGSTWTINGNVSTALTLNTWSHVAAVRSGNKWSIYVNGVENVIAASTAVTPYNSTDPLGIGGEAAGTLNYPYVGYMTDVRIVKGTAVYTTNFTPPTTPLTAIANTSLLTLQNNQPNNNSMFLDSSTSNFNITRNGNTTQGSFSPYGGGWSAYFDGDGDNLILAPNAGFSFGTGDFTVEFWVYYPPYSNVDGKMVLDSRPGSTNGPYWVFGANGSGIMTFTTMTSGGVTISDTVARTNQWVHYAATRSGTSLRLFANGTQVASATNSNNMSSSDLRIGTNAFAGSSPTTQWVGYISNVRIVKGTAVYTSNFTPSTTPLTPIANTQLLTCADNRFIDDSPNNFAITRNGNTSIQRFNPFNPVTTTPTSYSGYFDGNGDYLSIASNAALSWGTGDYTVEAWVYLTSAQSRIMVVSGVGNFAFFTNSSANIIVGRVGTDELTSTGTVTLNQWVHIAATRSSNTTRIFINGTLSSTPTSITTNYGQNLTYIGSDATIMTTGYISNFRAIKGTALYTSNFTPSTTPLTAVANTSLLTLQSPTFIDNSTNNFTITNNGDTAPRQFNPFGWTTTTGSSAAYTPALYGGSAYFDGTGDWLTAPDSTVFDVPGDYTVELWFYPAVSGGLQRLFMIGDYRSTFNGLDLYVNGSNQLVFYSNGASIITGGSVVNFQWNHVALVRRGSSTNNTTLYLNGISVGQATNTTSFTGVAANGVSIGLEYSGAATSVTSATYISDARLSNGTARYTSNFAPPVAPLTALANTTLLTNMTGAGIYDSSMMNIFETFGNASINTSIKQYGNTSLFFDGTGDYLVSPASPANILGSGNFTVEAWIYPSNITTAYRALISSENYPSTTGGWSIYQNGAAIEVWLSPGSAVFINATSVLTANTWQHLAVVRSGSTVTVYVNGTSRATGTNSATWTGQRIWMGDNNTGTPDYFFIGYMDDVRITPGIARYTSNFTPPAVPFINY